VRLRRLPSHLVLILLGVLAGAILPATGRGQVPVRRDTVSGRKDTVPTRTDTSRARAARPPALDTILKRDTIRVPLPPRADTVLKNDTTRLASKTPKPDSARIRRDTIQPPLARAPVPPIIEIGAPLIYDRNAIFATGSLTLSDLLGRLLGFTEYTAGWLGAPAAVAYLGDDITDEDAFRAIECGIGVLVGLRPTAASHKLDGIADVDRFLGWLAARASNVGRRL